MWQFKVGTDNELPLRPAFVGGWRERGLESLDRIPRLFVEE